MSLGFYVDMTRCAGCGTCTYACKDRLDLGTIGVSPRRVNRYQVGTFPAVTGFATSVSCNHCENPACVANCPTGAMFKDSDGIVLHDDSVCIGCQTCVSACPYGAPQYVAEDNLVVKCDTCKALREAGEQPVCVEACAYRALEFGDMDELRKKHGSDLVSEIPAIASAEATGPNLLLKTREPATSQQFVEVTY